MERRTIFNLIFSQKILFFRILSVIQGTVYNSMVTADGYTFFEFLAILLSVFNGRITISTHLYSPRSGI